MSIDYTALLGRKRIY